MLVDLLLLDCLAVLGNDAREEAKRFQVLQDVTRLGRDQHHLELVDRLIDVAHALCLDERVLLGARADELGERGQQALDSPACHVHEFTRDDCFFFYMRYVNI